MNKFYKMLKQGNYCSVGLFGDDVYAFENFTGFADVPEYVQITKAEFESFKGNEDFGERKVICSGCTRDIDRSLILSDSEIEQKKKDKTLWRAGVYSRDDYDGQGVVVFDYVPYKLTRRAYTDIPLDTSLLGGFPSMRQGYLWALAYEEVERNEHPKGTYCETIGCDACGHVFYFDDTTIPAGTQYEAECPACHVVMRVPAR